jgi:hypothetical protein
MATKARYLAYEKIYNEESKSWGLMGHDKTGDSFGIGLGETLEIAREKLKAWALFRLEMVASQGIDGEKWLEKKESRDCLVFESHELNVARRRLRVARGEEERGVSRRVGEERRGEGRREADIERD